MVRVRLLLVAVLVAVLVGACARGGEPGAGSSGSPAVPPCVTRGLISIGERLPDCSFEGMEGQPVLQVRALEGKPAVLNFWASWCTFCIKEMPDFQRVYESLGGRVEFVGLDVLELQGETKGAAEAFRRKTGVSYRLAYDPNGRFYAHFQPNVHRPIMPVTVFVDDGGIVRERHFGPLDEKELRDKVRTLFGVA